MDALLAEPFANWHVDTTTETHQLRVTKKGVPLLHTSTRTDEVAPSRGHDRAKDRLLAEDHPVLVALGDQRRPGAGQADPAGEVPPGGGVRPAARREPHRGRRAGAGAHPDRRRPAARGRPGLRQRLPDVRRPRLPVRTALPVRVTGVDVKQQSADHNARVAADLGIDADFVVGSIADARLDQAPDVVLALHACDTATDDALARALEWEAPLVLAAPCCHHDIAAQLRTTRRARALRDAHPPRHPARALRRHPHRRAARRAAAPRGLPRRRRRVRRERAHPAQHAAAGGAHAGPRLGRARLRTEYDDLVATWGVRPRLASCSPGMTMRERYLLGIDGGPRRGPVPARRGRRCSGPADTRSPGSRTPRSSSPAGWRSSTGCSCHHQRLRRLRPGLHRRPGDRRDGRRDARGPRTRSTSRPWPPRVGGEVWVGDIGDNRPQRASVSVAAGAGRPREPRRRRADVRAGLPRRPTRRRVAGQPPRDRPALRHHQGRLRRHGVRRPAAAARRPAQPPDRGRPGAGHRHGRHVPARRGRGRHAHLLDGPPVGVPVVAGRRVVAAARPGPGRGRRPRRGRAARQHRRGPLAGAPGRPAGRRPARPTACRRRGRACAGSRRRTACRSSRRRGPRRARPGRAASCRGRPAARRRPA